MYAARTNAERHIVQGDDARKGLAYAGYFKNVFVLMLLRLGLSPFNDRINRCRTRHVLLLR